MRLVQLAPVASETTRLASCNKTPFRLNLLTVTTILSQKGQILLPGVIREQLHLQAGDDFEVTIEDEDTITLRRVSHPANRGLVDLLLACPGPFEIPVREKDDTAPPSF